MVIVRVTMKDLMVGWNFSLATGPRFRGPACLFVLTLRSRSDFCGLCSDESVIHLRQGIEVRGLLAKLLRLVEVTFPLISLAQAIKIVRVLLVGLLQFADRFVVVFLLESDHAN